MKITLTAIGISKISALKLVRKYSGCSLKEANDLISDLPASFMTKTSYDKIDEMFTEFESEGCSIVIETGYAKPEIVGTKRAEKLIFGVRDESTEKKQLSTKEQISEFLKTRQDIKRAYAGGIIASAVLILVFGVFFIQNEIPINWKTYVWTSNIIIGFSIGYSVRRRGKSVDPKTGKFAAALTVFTAIFVRYLYDFVMTVKFYTVFNFRIYYENIYEIWFVITVVLAAVSAYFLAWDKISDTKSSSNRARFSGNKISDIVSQKIEERKASLYKQIKNTKIK